MSVFGPAAMKTVMTGTQLDAATCDMDIGKLLSWDLHIHFLFVLLICTFIHDLGRKLHSCLSMTRYFWTHHE